MLKTGIPTIDTARATPIVGSDEAGYGAWAGPLLTCAVAVSCDWEPTDPEFRNRGPGNPWRDSKMLTETERERIFDRYWLKPNDSIVISPYVMPPEEIDRLGASAALRLAHRLAIQGTFHRLPVNPIVIVDGSINPNLDPEHNPQVFCLPKGDQIVPAITLASVIAKVYRDREMARFAQDYPGYGFEKHKGYGTKVHEEALRKLGPCPIHRRSYAPIKAFEQQPARPAWDIDPNDVV